MCECNGELSEPIESCASTVIVGFLTLTLTPTLTLTLILTLTCAIEDIEEARVGCVVKEFSR